MNGTGHGVKTHHMVTQGAEIGDAVLAAVGVRGPKIGGEEAEDVGECLLVLEDLLAATGGVELLEIGVRPGVAADLVAGVMHAAQDLRVLGLGVVDAPVLGVVADHEERRLDVLVLVQKIEQLRRVPPRPVVERQRDLAGLSAPPDVQSVGHRPELWPLCFRGVPLRD